MNSKQVTYTIGGVNFNATEYSPSNNFQQGGSPYNDYDAFGCDYVTVLFTDNKDHIQEVLSRVSLPHLGDDYISVVEMGDLYAIYCDIDQYCTEEQQQELLNMGIVGFGAMMDDEDAISAINAYQYCIDNSINDETAINDEYERISDVLEDTEDDDEIGRLDGISCMLDGYSRIIEYNTSKDKVDDVLSKLSQIKKLMENNGADFDVY